MRDEYWLANRNRAHHQTVHALEIRHVIRNGLANSLGTEELDLYLVSINSSRRDDDCLDDDRPWQQHHSDIVSRDLVSDLQHEGLLNPFLERCGHHLMRREHVVVHIPHHDCESDRMVHGIIIYAILTFQRIDCRCRVMVEPKAIHNAMCVHSTIIHLEAISIVCLSISHRNA